MSRFYLETIHPLEYRMAQKTFDISGILTTPQALAAAGKNPLEMISQLNEAMKPDSRLFIQLVSTDYAKMLQEAVSLSNFDDDFCLQVPLTRDGLQVLKAAGRLKVHMVGCCCFSALQAYTAAMNGAQGIVFYYNQLDNHGRALETIASFQKMRDQSDLECEILVGGFRNCHQIEEVLKLGVEGIVLPLGLFNEMIHEPLTTMAAAAAASDWQEKFHQDGFFSSPEDEGVQADLKKLKTNE